MMATLLKMRQSTKQGWYEFNNKTIPFLLVVVSLSTTNKVEQLKATKNIVFSGIQKKLLGKIACLNMSHEHKKNGHVFHPNLLIQYENFHHAPPSRRKQRFSKKNPPKDEWKNKTKLWYQLCFNVKQFQPCNFFLRLKIHTITPEKKVKLRFEYLINSQLK